MLTFSRAGSTDHVHDLGRLSHTPGGTKDSLNISVNRSKFSGGIDTFDLKTTLETGGEDVKIHSKRVEKI